jgi:hypothetical protein
MTFAVEGRPSRDGVSAFRCSKEGITPMDEGPTGGPPAGRPGRQR